MGVVEKAHEDFRRDIELGIAMNFWITLFHELGEEKAKPLFEEWIRKHKQEDGYEGTEKIKREV